MTVSIDFKSDSSQAQKDLEKLNKSVQNIEKQASAASKAFKAIGASLVASLTAAGGFTVFKNLNDEFTNMRNRIRLVTGETYALAEAQRELTRIAQKTRTTFAGATDVYSRLGLAMKDSGRKSKEFLAVTETIQKTVSLSGASIESAEAALVQLGQGFASGQLRGQELNSVLEQLPRLAQAIADGMNIPFGSLRAEAEKGNITAQAVFKALREQAGAVEAEFSSMVPTISQGMLVLRQSLKLGYNEISEAASGPSGFGASLVKMSESVDKLSTSFARNLPERMASIRQVFNDVMLIAKPLGSVFYEMGATVLTLVPKIQLLETIFLQAKTAILENMYFVRAIKKVIFDFVLSLKELHFVSKAFNINPVRVALYDILNLRFAPTREYLVQLSAGFTNLAEAIHSVRTGEHWLTAIRAALFDLKRQVYITGVSLGIFREGLIKIWSKPIYFNVMIDGFAAVQAKAVRTIRIIKDGILSMGDLFTVFWQKVSYPVKLFTGQLSLLDRSFRFIDNLIYDYDKLFSFGNANFSFDELTDTAEYAVNKISKLFRSFADNDFIGSSLREAMGNFSLLTEYLDIKVSAAFRKMFKKSNVFENLMDGARDAVRYVRLMFRAITTGHPLEKTWRYIKNFSKDIIDFFFNIWDEVVGHSWWPDTIDGVIDYTRKLVPGVSGFFSDFARKVYQTFNPDVSGINKLGSALKSALNGITLEVRSIDVGNALSGAIASMSRSIGDLKTTMASAFQDASHGILVALGLTLLTWVSKLSLTVPAVLAALFTPHAGATVIESVDAFFEQIFGRKLLSDIGALAGTSVGTMLAEVVNNLPKSFSRIFKFVGEVFRGFFENLPIVGWVAKPLFALFEMLSLENLLGVLGAGLTLKAVAPFLQEDNVVRVFANNMTKAVSAMGSYFGLVRAAEAPVKKAEKAAKKTQNGFFYDALLGAGKGVGFTRLIGLIGSFATVSGMLDGLVNDSLLAKFVIGSGFLGAFFGGDEGVRNVRDKVIGTINDIVKGLRIGRQRALIASGNVDSLNPAAIFAGSYSQGAGKDIRNWIIRVTKETKGILSKFAEGFAEGLDISDKVGEYFRKMGKGKTIKDSVADFTQTIFTGVYNSFNKLDFKSFFDNIKKMAASSTASISKIAGKDGVLGKYLFGKTGIAALIAAVLIFFSSTSSAAEEATGTVNSFWEAFTDPVVITGMASLILATVAPLAKLLKEAKAYRKRRTSPEAADATGTADVVAGVVAGEAVAGTIGSIIDKLKLGGIVEKLSSLFGKITSVFSNRFTKLIGTLLRSVGKVVGVAVRFIFSMTGAIVAGILAATAGAGLLLVGLMGKGSFTENIRNAYEDVKWFWKNSGKEANRAQKRFDSIFSQDDRDFNGDRYGVKTNFDSELSNINLENLSGKEADLIDKKLSKYQELLADFRQNTQYGVFDESSRENLKIYEAEVTRTLDRLSNRSAYTLEDMRENLDNLFTRDTDNWSWGEYLTHQGDRALTSMLNTQSNFMYGLLDIYKTAYNGYADAAIDPVQRLLRKHKQRREEGYENRRERRFNRASGKGLQTANIQSLFKQGENVGAFDEIENAALDKAFREYLSKYQASVAAYNTAFENNFANGAEETFLSAIRENEKNLTKIMEDVIEERLIRDAKAARISKRVDPIRVLVNDLSKAKIDVGDFDAYGALVATDSQLEEVQSTLEKLKKLADSKALADSSFKEADIKKEIDTLLEQYQNQYRRFVTEGTKNFTEVLSTSLTNVGIEIPKGALSDITAGFAGELGYETERLRALISNFQNDRFVVPVEFNLSEEEISKVTKNSAMMAEFINSEREKLYQKVLNNTNNYKGRLNLFDLAGISLEDTLAKVNATQIDTVVDVVRRLALEKTRVFSNLKEQQDSILKVKELTLEYNRLLNTFGNITEVVNGLSSNGFNVIPEAVNRLDLSTMERVKDLLRNIAIENETLSLDGISQSEATMALANITMYKDELDDIIDKTKTLRQKFQDVTGNLSIQLDERVFSNFGPELQEELFSLSDGIQDVFAAAENGAIELADALAIERILSDRAANIVNSNLNFAGKVKVLGDAFGLTATEVTRLSDTQINNLLKYAQTHSIVQRAVNESENGMDIFGNTAKSLSESLRTASIEAKVAAGALSEALSESLKDIGVNADSSSLDRLGEGERKAVLDMSEKLRLAREALKNSNLQGSARAEAFYLIDAAAKSLQEGLDGSVKSYFESDVYKAGQSFASSMTDSLKSGVTDILTGKDDILDVIGNMATNFTNKIVGTVVDGFFSNFTNEQGTGKLDTMFADLGAQLFNFGKEGTDKIGLGKTDVPEIPQETLESINYFAAEDIRHTDEMLKFDNLIAAVKEVTKAIDASAGGSGGTGGAPDVSKTSASGLSDLSNTVAPTEDPLGDLGKTVTNGNGAVVEATEGLKSPMWESVKTTAGGFKDLISNNLAGFTLIASGLATAQGGDTIDKVLGVAQMAIGAFSIYSGGAAAGFAAGGKIVGPGTGTSDSILAAVSNGEFVVNAAATAKNARLLEFINNGGDIGMLPRFAAGGPVSGRMDRSDMIDKRTGQGGRASSEQTFNMEITGDISRQTRSEIQKMIPLIAAGVNQHNYESGRR